MNVKEKRARETLKRDMEYWKRISSHYDNALSIYEETAEPRSKAYETYEDRFLDTVLDEHVKNGPTMFVEVGSGTGRYIVRYGCRISRSANCEIEKFDKKYERNLLLICGLDFSYDMLSVCLDKLKKNNLEEEIGNRILLINGLAEEFSLSPDRVDRFRDAKVVVCCMFNTLGNIEPAKRRRRVLEKIHDLIYPNGEAVISVFNKQVFNEEGVPYYQDKRIMKLIYPPGGTKLSFRSKMGEVRTDDFFSHWFSEREFKRLLRKARLFENQPVTISAKSRAPSEASAKRGIIARVRAR